MKEINWNEVPDILTKEQFYKLCHISKKTARFLLESGKVPCTNSGKKTRCYRIRKTDAMAYLQDREICPENYKAIPGWYIEGCKSTGKPIQLDEIPPELLKYLPAYYTELLEHESDVMTTDDISRFTGYSKCAVNGWVKRGHLRAFQRGSSNLVPKVFLVEFFCSKAFRTTQRRNAWHIHAVQYFPLWVQCKTLKNAEQATE